MELSRFLNLSLSAITPFAMRCAAELKISDHIDAYDQSAMPLNELARAIPIPPEKEPMLGQVMRLLVQLGVFAQSEKGYYMLSPVSELMLSKGANMGTYTCLMTDPHLVNPLFGMADWFRSTGVGTMHQMAHEGKSMWEFAKETPDFGTLFNAAMANHSKVLMKDIVKESPLLFEGLKSLVDVGGGTGAAVEVVAKNFPKLRCTVFDLPHVIANAPRIELFDVVGGNMFEKIPTADAILLKNVLHDWSDEDCIKILSKCREAIPTSTNGAKIIIVELTIDLENNDQITIETSLFYDIGMMVGFTAKERTKQEWHSIFHGAGFVDYRVHKVGVFSIYELLS